MALNYWDILNGGKVGNTKPKAFTSLPTLGGAGGGGTGGGSSGGTGAPSNGYLANISNALKAQGRTITVPTYNAADYASNGYLANIGNALADQGRLINTQTGETYHPFNTSIPAPTPVTPRETAIGQVNPGPDLGISTTTVSAVPAPAADVNATVTPPVSNYQTPYYMQGAQEGYAGLRDIARGQSNVADMIRDEARAYLAGTQAADTGFNEQLMASQGISPESRATLGLMRGREQDVARGALTKDLAIDEATRAENAQKDLITMGDTMLGLEKGQYQYQNLMRTTEGQRLAAALQAAHDAGVDWKTDPNVAAAAQAAWEANGFSGMVDQNWIGQQDQIANVNPIDVAFNDYMSSDMFAQLPAEEQQAFREAAPHLAQMVAIGGVPGTDEDGKFVIYRPDGTVWYRDGEGLVGGNSGDGGNTIVLDTTTLPTRTLNGLRYVTDNSNPGSPVYGKLLDGDTFSLSNSATVESLGYTLPVGSYQVDVDDKGNVWYKNTASGQYYLASSSDTDLLSTIQNNYGALSRVSSGMNSTDLSFVYDYGVKATPMDKNIQVGMSSVLPSSVEWVASPDKPGVFEAKISDNMTFRSSSSANVTPTGFLKIVAKSTDERWADSPYYVAEDANGKLWAGFIDPFGTGVWMEDIADFDDRDRRIFTGVTGYQF